MGLVRLTCQTKVRLPPTLDNGAKLRPSHVILLIVIVLIVFGAPRLPEVARNLGKSARILKEEVRELSKDDAAPAASAPATGTPAPAAPVAAQASPGGPGEPVPGSSPAGLAEPAAPASPHAAPPTAPPPSAPATGTTLPQ